MARPGGIEGELAAGSGLCPAGCWLSIGRLIIWWAQSGPVSAAKPGSGPKNGTEGDVRPRPLGRGSRWLVIRLVSTGHSDDPPTPARITARPGQAEKSPTALKFLKHSFNTDTEHQAGLANVASDALELYVQSEEGREGPAAFAEKRPPDFGRFA